MVWTKAASLFLVAIVPLTAGGCGGRPTKGPETQEAALGVMPVGADWCVEHGVPESICALCNAKVAAEYRQKDDWCEEHERPESQCFLCNPQLAEKFAEEYERKYGQKPPKPEG